MTDEELIEEIVEIQEEPEQPASQNWIVYKPETGQIVSQIFDQEFIVEMSLGSGDSYMAHPKVDIMESYIQDGVVVPKETYDVQVIDGVFKGSLLPEGTLGVLVNDLGERLHIETEDIELLDAGTYILSLRGGPKHLRYEGEIIIA